MVSNGKRLGELLLHADIVTKRQLQKAIDIKEDGDKRRIGEILIDLDYITVADLTEVMMEQATKATSEKEKSKRDFLLQKQILKSKTKSQPVKQTIIEKKPTELSEDTKFNVSIKTMISVAVGIATVVGFYYVLKSDIEIAKSLPAPGVGSYPSLDLRDPSVAWPPSKHQYNDQYDNMVDAITDLEEEIEELNDKVRDLELKVAKLEK
jgi:hypothetical protein